MKFTSLPLEGVWLIEAEPFRDHRGQFARLYCGRELAEIGMNTPLAQINHSLTRAKGAVRGLHYQNPPHAEAKIVRCLRGACFDVAVDLRRKSPTFLQWQAMELTPENMRALYIPEGFAHGFQTLEPDTELLYFHTEFYTPGSEGAIRFDDPAIGVDWPIKATDLSDRDRSHPLITDDFTGIDI